MLTLTDDITSGSLFSGFGGLDRAIERVFGARTVWVSDIEPGPRKVLAHRWPGVPNLGDITAVDWDTVPEVDLAGGGSPCQDISSAGRRAGMVEGTRSNLWVEMREAIRHLRPMFVVWENVQAARSTRAASRYWPDHIDRCIAHHLAVSKETSHAPTKARHRRAAHRLMEQRARRVGVPYPKPALRALGRVLGDLADLGYDTVWVSLPASGVGAPHLRRRYFVLGANTAGQRWLAANAASIGHERSRDSRRGRDGLADGNRGPLICVCGHDVVAHRYAAAISRWEAIIGPAPNPTKPGKKGRPKLNPAFAEWMMGAPAGWITKTPGVTDNEALRMAGNGVVEQQAVAALEWCIEQFLAVIEAERSAA